MLDGTIVFADVVNDAGDAERAGEAQQVSHDAERDAEDERPAESFPQSQPDPLRTLRCSALRLLSERSTKKKQTTGIKVISMVSEII